MGIFWPGRELEKEPMEQHEIRYLKSEQLTHGTTMWGTFTALLGSSTRCEMATVLVAMLRRKPVHVATDSLALVRKGTTYLGHMQAREEMATASWEAGRHTYTKERDADNNGSS